MADFNMTFQTSENMSADFEVTSVIETGNYNNLGNKPQINDIEVIDNNVWEPGAVGTEALWAETQ